MSDGNIGLPAILANYETVRRAFDELLQDGTSSRALLLKGENGYGKTSLVSFFRGRMSPPAAQTTIQLRRTYTGVVEIFTRIGDVLEWDNLPQLMKRIAALDAPQAVTIDRTWMVGIGNKIDIVLAVDKSERERRLTALTSAWFADLAELGRRLVLFFDTFEDAPTEVQDWITGPLMWRVCNSHHVRVVIAGSVVPDARNAEWSEYAIQHELTGVREWSHWIPVVEQLGCRIPPEEVRTCLSTLCYVTKGNPDAMVKFLKGLCHEDLS